MSFTYEHSKYLIFIADFFGMITVIAPYYCNLFNICIFDIAVYISSNVYYLIEEFHSKRKYNYKNYIKHYVNYYNGHNIDNAKKKELAGIHFTSHKFRFQLSL